MSWNLLINIYFSNVSDITLIGIQKSILNIIRRPYEITLHLCISHSVQIFTDFFEETLKTGVFPNELSNPAYFSGQSVLAPGEEYQFARNIENKTYLMVGPMALDMPKPSDLNSDMVHIKRGVDK